MSRMPAIQKIDTAELLEQAVALGQVVGERAAEAGKAAALLAEQGKDWAQPRVEAAIEWATPKVENAWREGVIAAAPKIEAAADAVKPAVDTVHDRIVEEYLPKLVAAANAAASDAREASLGKAQAAVEAVQQAVAPKASHPVRTTFGWILVGSAIAGVGYLLWKRTRPTEDPWAEEYWDDAAPAAPEAPVTEAPAATDEPAQG